MKRKHVGTFTSLTEEENQQILGENVPPPPTQTLPSTQKVIDGFVNKKISLEQKKKIDQDLLDLCVDGFHPFSLVEERAFKKFCRWIPGYKLPIRKTLSNSLLDETYNRESRATNKG